MTLAKTASNEINIAITENTGQLRLDVSSGNLVHHRGSSPSVTTAARNDDANKHKSA